MSIGPGIKKRPAGVRMQPAIPRSTNRVYRTHKPGTPWLGKKGSTKPSTPPPTSPPAQIASQDRHPRRVSSARPASAQITLPSSASCAPRGRTPRSPKTPPRAPFRRSPKGNQATPPTISNKSTTSAPPTSTSTAARVPVNRSNDENVAPSGPPPESPPPNVPYRGKFKERRKPKGMKETFWENVMPPIHRAAKRRPKNWEDVSYYQNLEWDTDDEEYPKYVRPSKPDADPEAELPVLSLQRFWLPPCEGHKLKQGKDKTYGRYWLGMKPQPEESAAGKASKTVASKLPGHASEEEEDEEQDNENFGIAVPSEVIDPTTGLPKGDWVECRVEEVIARGDDVVQDGDRIRAEVASLFGEIMIEKHEIEEEGEATHEFWYQLLNTVDKQFFKEVVRTMQHAIDTGEVERMDEPFLRGEPEDLPELPKKAEAVRSEPDNNDLDDGYPNADLADLDDRLFNDYEALSDEELQRAVTAARKEWYMARFANLPPGAGYQITAKRPIDRKGRKMRKPPHVFISPGPSPLSGKKREKKKKDKAAVDKQNAKAPVASGSKQKDVTPKPAQVPNQAKDVPTTPSALKQNKEATMTASVPKQNAVPPKVVSAPMQKAKTVSVPKVNETTPSEEQYWEDDYVLDDDDTLDSSYYKNYSPISKEVSEERAAEEVTTESRDEVPSKDTSSMPQNPLKRSRDSDDEGESISEKQVPQAPAKKRKTSGSFGASDEETPVGSAPQAEYNHNLIDETDERSSNNGQTSAQGSGGDDEPRLEAGEVADDEDELTDEEESEEEEDEEPPLVDAEAAFREKAKAERKAALEYLRWVRRTSEDI